MHWIVGVDVKVGNGVSVGAQVRVGPIVSSDATGVSVMIKTMGLVCWALPLAGCMRIDNKNKTSD